MTIDEQIAVLQAYKEGKKIQFTIKESENWIDSYSPFWDFDRYDYRVKPEPPKPKYRPYQSAEEVMEGIKKHGSWVRIKDGFIQIVGISSTGCFLGHTTVRNFYSAFNDFTWPDGTPFGVKEE